MRVSASRKRNITEIVQRAQTNLINIKDRRLALHLKMKVMNIVSNPH
jgi:hypothetical protein